METFRAVVIIECEDIGKASKVLAERIFHEEDYGFEYTIDYDDLRKA